MESDNGNFITHIICNYMYISVRNQSWDKLCWVFSNKLLFKTTFVQNAKTDHN